MKINDDLHDLTNDPDKLTTSARNEAARIFRIVLRENGIDAKIFSTALKGWTERRAKRVPGDKSKNAHSNDRGNFVKAIIKDRISLDRLIMALQVLNPVSFSISIGLRFDRFGEKVVRFNYIDDPIRYKKVMGVDPPPYFKVIEDDQMIDYDDDEPTPTPTPDTPQSPTLTPPVNPTRKGTVVPFRKK